jgi:hypothetical protein
MTPQNATLDSKRTLSSFVSYRRLPAQFQFSLSADTLGYLSQWKPLFNKNVRASLFDSFCILH